MIQPKIIDIELTNVCNRECSFCLRSGMKRPLGTMDIRLFKKIIDELSSFEFPAWGKVVLAGFGEPTLHPRFSEAVDYAASRGLPLRIYTNASQLNKQVRKCLLQDGIRSVKISLNAHGPGQFRQMMGSGASWEETVTGLSSLITEQILQGSRREITLQLLYSGNLLPAVTAREKIVVDAPASALAALRFWQARIAEIAAAAGRKTSGRVVESKEISPGNVFNWLENIHVKLCQYLPYQTHFDPSGEFSSGLDYRPCMRHFNNIVVFWDGTCTPCCTDVQASLSLGNANNSSLLHVFNSEQAIRNRTLWQAGKPPQELCDICLKRSN